MRFALVRPTYRLWRSYVPLRTLAIVTTTFTVTNTSIAEAPPMETQSQSRAVPRPEPPKRPISTYVAEESSGMVPITREYLREFYKQFPDPSFSTSATRARENALKAGASLMKDKKPIKPPPNRMDEGMFAARCACEEAIIALSFMPKSDVGISFQRVANRLAKLQDTQRAHASAVVESFLPQDFRASLFQQARARSEARNKAEIDELVRNGGSVKDKFDCLWRQQWARRETLGSVGNATGIWKLAVRYIAGVPQPLLDFARQINVPNGPTEELRIKFAPVLQIIITMARELARLAETLAEIEKLGISEERALVALGSAVRELEIETNRFCSLLENVIEKSPFFISANNINGDQLKVK